MPLCCQCYLGFILQGYFIFDISFHLLLQTLSVKYNNFAGPLPESLGHLTDLTELMMQNNNFRLVTDTKTCTNCHAADLHLKETPFMQCMYQAVKVNG